MNRFKFWLHALYAGLLTGITELSRVMLTPIFQIVAVGLIAVVFPTAWFFGTMPDVRAVEKYQPWQSIQIFDKNNNLITTISGDEDRIYVPLSGVSDNMKKAVLSAEDRRFFEHPGADVSSMVRAAMANLQARRVVEGGSTISQQLVKNLFFKPGDRSLERKAREIVLAVQLEKLYPKERILEMYLNQVYFGKGAYGAEIAARRYFGKPAGKLEIHEPAFLAGLIKAPSTFADPAHRNEALERKNEILRRMAEDGHLTEEELNKWKNKPLAFKKRENHFAKYPYYISYLIEVLEKEHKIDVRNGLGLKVFTHLDPAVQKAGEVALTKGIEKAPKGINQGALVTVDVKTGGVLAMVGGVGPFMKHQWNRAVSGHTAGSSFKPFVYLSAFEKGLITPDSMIADAPVVIPQQFGAAYAPKNFDGQFKGMLPVSTALALSRNTCAVRAALMAGVPAVVSTARRAGISTKLDPYISLALGSAAVTPLEMSGAYACFVRQGNYIKPELIRRIEDANGKLVKEIRPRVERRFKPEATAMLAQCLQQAVERGTGTRARVPGMRVIGKTGTADGATDVWFIGVTPTESTAVWGGTDLPIKKRNNHITGGTVMAAIWRQHTGAYLDSKKDTKLAVLVDKKADSTSSSTDAAKQKQPPAEAKPSPAQVKSALPSAQPAKAATPAARTVKPALPSAPPAKAAKPAAETAEPVLSAPEAAKPALSAPEAAKPAAPAAEAVKPAAPAPEAAKPAASAPEAVKPAAPAAEAVKPAAPAAEAVKPAQAKPTSPEPKIPSSAPPAPDDSAEQVT